ncbi:MAG: TonB-dependent receptor [Sphingopyxis sp.]|nr:TonB-dependent receptor [Sphingopyxis sp.]
MTRLYLLASACTLALQANVLHAQEHSPVDDAPATEGAEDIVVTAQGRSQGLSKVPIAISAMSAEQLENSGSSDLRSLTQLAPSLTISGTTSEAKVSARIRGIGTTGGDNGLESSVALFIDGVYRARVGVGMNELGELERVEIQRGPQGTLSGRNSTAGAIYVFTRKPEFEFGGYASASYGNYDYFRAEGGVTGPLVADKLAVRLDASMTKRDGFIKQMTPGEADVNDKDRWLVRGQLLFEPTPDLSIRLIGDYSRRKENCCGAVYLNPIRTLSRDGQGNIVVSPNAVLPNLQALGANIQVAPDGEFFVFRTATTPGTPATDKARDWGVSGEVNWALGGINLTSITAYRDFRNKKGADGDMSALDLINLFDRSPAYRNFSQEVRLSGEAFGDRLSWLVGGYYSDEVITNFDNGTMGTDTERLVPALVTVANQLGARRLPGTGPVANTFRQDGENYAVFTHNIVQIVPDKLSLTLGLRYTHEKKQIENTMNATNDLCPKVINSIYQGTAIQQVACLFNSSAPALTHADPGTKISSGEFTGTAVLSYRPTDELMTYISYSRGYKSGGFNMDPSGFDPTCSTTAGTPAQNAACTALRALPANSKFNGRAEGADLQFGAEKVTAYEIGVKLNGRMIDANLALYYQSFRNFQFQNFNGVFFEVMSLASCKDDLNGGDTDLNAATGRCAADRLGPGVTSKGAELDVAIMPTDDLRFSFGFNYSDAKFKRNLTSTGGNPLPTSLFQLPGSRTYGSLYTAVGSMSWTPQIGNDLSGLVYLDFRFNSDNGAISNDGDIEKEQDGFGLINGRVGLYGKDKRWGVELWAQNLLNKKYLVGGTDAPLQGSGTLRAVAAGLQPTANQLSLGFPGDPRTYGVTIKTSF